MWGKLLIAALALVVTGFGSAPTKASVLFNNISAASDGSDGVVSAGPLYDSFKTGSTSFLFNHLELLLGGGSGGNLNVSLYSNQVPSGGPFSGSSIPGALIATIGNLSSVPAVEGDVIFNFSSILLAANSRYWIGLTSTNSPAVWFFSLDFSGTGVGSEFSFNTFGVLPNNPDGAYQMLVSGNETPLPAALPLFASGLGALGLAGWRRKRKAAKTG